MKGFITLHRKLLLWEWYSHIPTKTLFIHCLLRANHEKSNWRGNEIKRGQFITSIKKLSEETGLSEKQVRTSLDNLISTNELGKQSSNLNTLISVLNYDIYQTKGNPNGNPKANERQTKGNPTDKQRATNNNDNNDNNDNNEEQIKKPKGLSFNFSKALIDYGIEKSLVNEWLQVRKVKKSVNSQTAFNSIIKEIEKSNVDKNLCIKECVIKSWAGFNSEWMKKDKPKNDDEHLRIYQ